ncbi:MAG: orotate phosphoribosyltransferase [Acidimicrobiales bacterium]|nr:MAG: orotate phosphoribosyltransferase [Acidimicrobiales bacterium]
MNRVELAREIYHRSHLQGTFTLRSGATSNEYFDKYRFESDPVLLAEVGRAMVALVPPGTSSLAGLELGGVPLAVAMSALTGLPAVFVRKQAKAYGTARLAEGGEVAGLHLVVVEDVVTSGGQVVASCTALRELGAVITGALCVIDRGAGGTQALAAEGITLTALYRMSELSAAQDQVAGLDEDTARVRNGRWPGCTREEP